MSTSPVPGNPRDPPDDPIGSAPQDAAAAGDRHVDEATLMERLRADDAGALDVLLARYWSPIVSYARHLVGSVDTAEDIAQEAFVHLWQARNVWRAGSVPAFLFRAARTRALNEHRRRRRFRMVAARRPDSPGPPPPDVELESETLRRAFEDALASLPPRRREVFVLTRLQRLSHAEVAELLSLSPQTVANHLSAALAQLRTLLAPLHDRD